MRNWPVLVVSIWHEERETMKISPEGAALNNAQLAQSFDANRVRDEARVEATDSPSRVERANLNLKREADSAERTVPPKHARHKLHFQFPPDAHKYGTIDDFQFFDKVRLFETSDYFALLHSKRLRCDAPSRATLFMRISSVV